MDFESTYAQYILGKWGLSYSLALVSLISFCTVRSISAQTKGQTNSKWFFQAEVSYKKRMNKFDFTTCRLDVFVRFLEESEDTKKDI